jgi:hypothetical protein
MATNQESNSFSDFLKELTLPISTFIGIIIFMLEFKEKIELFSIKFIAVLIPLFCLLWLIFVWRKKKINDDKKIFSHKRIVRIGAILAFIFSLIPFYFVLISSLPVTINFQIKNNSKDTLEIRYLNDYNILSKNSYDFDNTVTSGLFRVNNRKKRSLIIMPNSTENFEGQFEDQSKLRYYMTGDYWITINIRTNNNIWMDCDKMLHLTREALNDGCLILYHETKKNKN